MGSVVSSVGSVLGKIGDIAGPILGGISKYGPLIQAGTGLLGAFGTYQSSKTASKAAQQAVGMADPFGKYRGQYAKQLQTLYQNPWQIADTPGYQFRLAQGLEGINRNAAASGMLGSGNRLMELMRYGQDYGSQEFDNEIARLMQLSGATMGSPTGAAQMNLLAGQLQGDVFGNTARAIGEAAGSIGDWWRSRQAPTGSSSYSPGALGVNLPGGGVYYYS